MELQTLHGLGGEALLYPNIDNLMKIARENGIKNKLITNGSVLAHNQNAREILNYLDTLTLSLDTIDDTTNEELGRGRKHFEEVKTILDYVQDQKLKVNINTATLEQLMTLPGVGESTAQKIITYRQQNGKFNKIEDIKSVSGIGESKFSKIEQYISIK